MQGVNGETEAELLADALMSLEQVIGFYNDYGIWYPHAFDTVVTNLEAKIELLKTK